MGRGHDITPLLGRSVHALSFPVIVLVGIVITVEVISGVVLILFAVLMPIAAPTGPIVTVGGEDLTASRRATQGMGIVAEVTIMAMVTTIATSLP